MKTTKYMKVEINRHVFHVAFGTILALLYSFNLIDKIHFVILLGISLIIFYIYKRYKIPVLHQAMLAMEREENMRKFPGKGAVLYVVGCTVAAWIFPKETAVASIIILAWGDGVAGLVRAYQKQYKKTWLSTIISIIAGTIAAQFFVPAVPALAATGAAMLFERLNLRVDDNLTIPIIAGAVLSIPILF